MRVVQVANFVTPTSGGLRTALDALAGGYARRGHQVVQVLPAASDSVAGTDWGRRVYLRGPSLPGTGYRVLTSPRRVQRAIAALEPDVLEVHDRTTLRGLGSWARAHRVPTITISHERVDRWLDQWLPNQLPLLAMADRSNAALAASFDTVVCTTEWAAEEFRRLGVEHLVTIPLGVDHAAFRPRLTPRSNDGVHLVMVSRLSREKQPEIAVEAVRELLRRGVNVRLSVAGDGPARRHLQERSAGLPIDWLGYVADRPALAALLRDADVALAPGPVETFGLAALEALSCGTPVVVNWRSALPAVIGSAGRVSAGSGFTFATSVQELLGEPESLRRLAARARAEEFSWEATVDAFLGVHHRAHMRRPAMEVAA